MGILELYTYQKNKGYAEARNTAIKISKYEWITIIDHDDIMTKNRLIDQVNEIKTDKNYALYLFTVK